MKVSPIATQCLLPLNIFMASNNFCHGGKQISALNLNCLSMVLEALLLYDKVITFDYSDALGFGDDTSFRSPILAELYNEQDTFITWADPYENMSDEDRISLAHKLMGSYRRVDGLVISNLLAGKLSSEPKVYINFEPKQIEELVRASLKIYEVPGELDSIHQDERTDFIQRYMSTQLWRIDQMRTLGEHLNVMGYFLLPQWEPLWQHERAIVSSALHEKFKQAEGMMLKTYLDDYSKIDVSTLTVVALNRTKKPEELPETIRVMRKEYSELRSAGSKYAKMLNEVETYGEAADVVREWSQAWEALLKRIASHSNTFPLIRKMFSWDVLKQLSARSFFLDSVETVFLEFKNLTITKKLWVVGRLKKQFLKSRLIEKRIKELYGS